MTGFQDAKNRLDRNSKKRVRVACNTCRKKKIRCDGGVRCVNCTIAQEPECIYDEKIPKPMKKPRSPKSGSAITHLNARLDRLETLIQSIARAISGSNINSGNSSKSLDPVHYSNSSVDDGECSESSHDEDDVDASSATKPGVLDVTGKKNEIYLGNHSFFSILSKSSLAWMKSHLPEDNQHLLVPLINLPFAFETKNRAFVNMWFGQKGSINSNHLELMKSPLPKNKEIVYEMVSGNLSSCNSIEVLCSEAETMDLLNRYYSSSNPNKRNIQLIGLFKLSVAILICMTDAREASFEPSTENVPENEKRSPVKGLSSQEFSSLQTQLTKVCMNYFFLLNVQGQGLETVKVLLFFAAFLAKCFEPHQVLLMVLTQAIRKALDMGLHRIETYRNLPREEFETRLLVWKTAYYIDLEICFRGGQPPIINHNDASEELRNNVSIFKSSSKKFPLRFMKNYDIIFEARLETYNRLFSASAEITTFESLEKNVDYLNDKMFRILDQMDHDEKVYFFNQPGFREVTSMDSPEEEHKVISQLAVMLNIMTINRLPMMFAYPGANIERLQMYRNLSLNSARTIMHMLKNFHAYGPKKAPSLWVTFFPLISVLHLSAACMSEPRSVDAHGDILLILEMCKTWFNRKLSPSGSGSFEFDISILLQALVKSVTSVAMSIFEKSTGIEILAEDKEFKDSFRTPLNNLPDLYGNPETLKNSMAMIFESNSPFTSTCTPTSQLSPTNSNPGDGVSFQGHLPTESSYNAASSQKNTPNYDLFGPGESLGRFENFVFDQLDDFPNFFFDGIGGETEKYSV